MTEEDPRGRNVSLQFTLLLRDAQHHPRLVQSRSVVLYHCSLAGQASSPGGIRVSVHILHPPQSLPSTDVTCVLVLSPPQDLLGDVVYVELPDVGMTVKKGGVWRSACIVSL